MHVIVVEREQQKGVWIRKDDLSWTALATLGFRQLAGILYGEAAKLSSPGLKYITFVSDHQLYNEHYVEAIEACKSRHRMKHCLQFCWRWTILTPDTRQNYKDLNSFTDSIIKNSVGSWVSTRSILMLAKIFNITLGQVAFILHTGLTLSS